MVSKFKKLNPPTCPIFFKNLDENLINFSWPYLHDLMYSKKNDIRSLKKIIHSPPHPENQMFAGLYKTNVFGKCAFF